jgi:hypothetical protein
MMTTTQTSGSCEHCGGALGCRLTSDRGHTWSWEHRKWFDLCSICTGNLLRHERYIGVVPRT